MFRKQVNENEHGGTMPQKHSMLEDIMLLLRQPGTGKLRYKAVLLLVTFILLVVLIVAGTVAWYTRISTVTGLYMDVATFDFNASYVETAVLVKPIDEGHGVATGKAAPGSHGVIPILLDNEESGTSATYALDLNFVETAPEFRRKIRYYYYAKDPADNTTVRQYTLGQDGNVIRGELAAGAQRYEYIHWEWVFDLNEDTYFNTNLDEWVRYGKYYDETEKQWKEGSFPDAYEEGYIVKDNNGDPLKDSNGDPVMNEYDKFDEIDTKIGLGEYNEEFISSNTTTYAKETTDDNSETYLAYQVAMRVKVTCSGLQAAAQPIGDPTANVTGSPGMTMKEPPTGWIDPDKP